MSLFPSQPDLVGMDFQGPLVRIAALKQQRRTWHVLHLKEVPVKGNLSDAVLKNAIVSTAIEPSHVLIRPLHMQLTKEKDIRSALGFQVESLLPFPADQALVEAQIIAQNEKGSTLTLSVVKKDHLKKHLEKVAPIEPESVSCLYCALCAFSSLLPETAHRLLLIHIGEADVACALVENGKLLKAHCFERSKDFHREIKKTVLALSPKAFESIYLLGSEDPYFVDEVKKATGETPHYPTIPSLHLSQERLVKFAVAIGTALASQKINFRKKEFSYPYPLKRLKKPFVLFLSLACLLTISLFVFTKFSLSRQEKQVLHAYQTLLASCERQEANMPRSPSDYNIELQKIEKEILSRPDTFPLLPGVPRVREALSFLTNQAKGIHFQRVRYQMVKRPQFQQKKEHYRVRLDLEFAAEDASVAREFHERLIHPNSIVDPKADVVWESSKGCYKASFFLKDKTRYHG